MSYLIFLFLSLVFLKATGLASMSLLVMFSPVLFFVLLLASIFLLGVGAAAVEYIKAHRKRRK